MRPSVWEQVEDLFQTVDVVREMVREQMCQFRPGEEESDYILGERCVNCTFRPQVANHCLALDFGVPVPMRVCNSRWGLRPQHSREVRERGLANVPGAPRTIPQGQHVASNAEGVS